LVFYGDSIVPLSFDTSHLVSNKSVIFYPMHYVFFENYLETQTINFS
jgi:hypothetical protein